MADARDTLLTTLLSRTQRNPITPPVLEAFMPNAAELNLSALQATNPFAGGFRIGEEGRRRADSGNFLDALSESNTLARDTFLASQQTDNATELAVALIGELGSGNLAQKELFDLAGVPSETAALFDESTLLGRNTDALGNVASAIDKFLQGGAELENFAPTLEAIQPGLTSSEAIPTSVQAAEAGNSLGTVTVQQFLPGGQVVTHRFELATAAALVASDPEQWRILGLPSSVVPSSTEAPPPTIPADVVVPGGVGDVQPPPPPANEPLATTPPPVAAPPPTPVPQTGTAVHPITPTIDPNVVVPGGAGSDLPVGGGDTVPQSLIREAIPLMEANPGFREHFLMSINQIMQDPSIDAIISGTIKSPERSSFDGFLVVATTGDPNEPNAFFLIPRNQGPIQELTLGDLVSDVDNFL